MVGASDGHALGTRVGRCDGCDVGSGAGKAVGSAFGDAVGRYVFAVTLQQYGTRTLVGTVEGLADGICVGSGDDTCA